MKWLFALGLVVSACSSGAVGDTSTTVTTITTTTATSAATSTTQPPADCPEAPYELGTLPEGVGQGDLESETIETDVWTEVGGSHTTFFPRNDGTVAIALIRGTLPAIDWPNEKGEVNVDGTPAVVGPHPDGTWVAGWYEEPGERCDLYTMVFYPPWNPSDVEEVLLGMNRVGG